ncbi:MAG: serine/threonine protein kinase [Myxococcota bacterium]
MVEDIFGIIGTTLAGAFHVEEVIAEGGYGVVYRAEHVAFRAPVALKCLKIPGTISPEQSETFVENFREEAEILFHLSAQIPEVVRPLHADAMTLREGTFVPYIAMEWIDGKPLDSIVIMREDDGLPPLAVRKAVKMLAPIARALSRAHRFQVPGGAVVSVTHCDLKPENIVITDRDNPVRAKILDFGIAKARDSMRQTVGRITATEQARPFTPSYGAPEQWVPKRYGQSGPWTDVWGLALTLVECVTGRPPIDGEMHAMMGTALDRSRRPTPRTEGVIVDDEVERVFARALAVDPRDRYTDIASFWTELEDAVGRPRTFRDEPAPRVSYDDLEEVRDAALASVGARPVDADAAAEPGEFGLELEAPPSRPPSATQPLSASEAEEWIPSSAPPSEEPLTAPTSSARGFESGEFLVDAASHPPPSSVAAEAPTSADMPLAAIDLDLEPAPRRPAPSAPGSGPRGPAPRASLSSSSSAAGGRRPGAVVGSSTRRWTPPSDVAPGAAAPSTLAARLKVPMAVVAIGMVLVAVDVVLTRTAGAPLALGPIRIRWVAAACVALGVVLAMVSLVGGGEDE